MKKKLVAFAFLILCNFPTFGQVSLKDFQTPEKTPGYVYLLGIILIIVIILFIMFFRRIHRSGVKMSGNTARILSKIGLFLVGIGFLCLSL